MRGKNIENKFLPPPKKKTNFVSKCSKDKKKLLNYIQLAEKYALSVKNLFFSHSHPKTAPKRRIWSKCCFFVAKIVVLKGQKTGIKA